MTCKDCVHYAVCKFMDGEICNHFKDNSVICELSIKVPDSLKEEFTRYLKKGVFISYDL